MKRCTLLMMLVPGVAMAQEVRPLIENGCYQRVGTGQKIAYSIAPIFDSGALDDLSFTYVVPQDADVTTKLPLTSQNIGVAVECEDGGWAHAALSEEQSIAVDSQLSSGAALSELTIPGLDLTEERLTIDARIAEVEGADLYSLKLQPMEIAQ